MGPRTIRSWPRLCSDGEVTPLRSVRRDRLPWILYAPSLSWESLGLDMAQNRPADLVLTLASTEQPQSQHREHTGATGNPFGARERWVLGPAGFAEVVHAGEPYIAAPIPRRPEEVLLHSSPQTPRVSWAAVCPYPTMFEAYRAPTSFAPDVAFPAESFLPPVASSPLPFWPQASSSWTRLRLGLAIEAVQAACPASGFEGEGVAPENAKVAPELGGDLAPGAGPSGRSSWLPAKAVRDAGLTSLC